MIREANVPIALAVAAAYRIGKSGAGADTHTRPCGLVTSGRPAEDESRVAWVSAIRVRHASPARERRACALHVDVHGGRRELAVAAVRIVIAPAYRVAGVGFRAAGALAACVDAVGVRRSTEPLRLGADTDRLRRRSPPQRERCNGLRTSRRHSRTRCRPRPDRAPSRTRRVVGGAVCSAGGLLEFAREPGSGVSSGMARRERRRVRSAAKGARVLGYPAREDVRSSSGRAPRLREGRSTPQRSPRVLGAIVAGLREIGTL
jgi:hypothetical protein